MDARYVDIGKIAHVIGQDACKALPGLHAFTGCHPLSAFSGEVKPLKKLLSKKEYQRAFQQLGVNWLRSEDPLMQLKAFVCDMYGAKNGISDVNQCIYSVSCAFSTYYLPMRNTYHSGPEHRLPSLILL